METTKRFDGKAEIYAKGRPAYAPALFEQIRNSLCIPEGSVFADVGSGTGIFTKQLLECGYRVYAVEPNGDMRRKAEETLRGIAGFLSVKGTDGQTGLPDSSVDAVTAAQAFHWFDPVAFKKECRRILKPDGQVMIIYNQRDEESPCTQALARLRRRYCAEFRGFSGGMTDEKCIAFFDGECTVFRSDNSRTYDRQGYMAQVLSSSYSLREGDAGYGEYLADINALFDAFSQNHRLTLPIHTVAFIGKV